MKKVIIGSFVVVAMLALMVGSAMTKGKPQEVIERSNGFPSGMHFNLNIHGKKAEYICDDIPGGGSVFICEYGESTIQYVSNKKSSLTELVVLDPCSDCFDNPPDNDPVKVMLPHKVDVDGEVIPAEGYYVFGRILGKPNNSSNDGDPSSIILYPNQVVEACNDTDPANPDFPGYTECPDDPLLALGLIVGTNLYTADLEGYVRFDPEAAKGKGKSKATDITRLFTYEGWVVDATLDTMTNDAGVCSLGPDGVIDECDVPAEYDLEAYGGNDNGEIDLVELKNWLNDQAALDPPHAWYFEQEWIFNIADLVITEQGLVNDGTKLLQIRFYPVATTEFEPQPQP